MISDAIALYELLRGIRLEHRVLSALFDADGSRVEGDDELSVRVHQGAGDTNKWWYETCGPTGYEFVRIPVNVGGVVESLGQAQGQGSRDSKYFRYVAAPDGRVHGDLVNVRVNFMVFAYRPKDLLNLGEGRIA